MYQFDGLIHMDNH